jgi:antitoxin component HigA of HigAB toxin-antitoxin module
MGLIMNLERYGELLRRETPQRIRSDAEYDYWADWIEGVQFGKGSTREEKALAELMLLALEDYDKRKNPELFQSSPLATLRHLMESNGLSQVGLAALLGVTRSTTSLIVSGKREISKGVAKKLSQHFGLPLEAFL